MNDRGAVVVTGASTGIGEATALHLAELGFRVFAGVRREPDGDRLRQAAGAGKLVPLPIDVIDAGSIAGAVDQVAGEVGDAGISGLVNNAGVAVSAPLEFIPVDELRRQLEVNVIGQVAVTQAFLPMLRAAGGRIVNMGSVGGRVAMPLLGPYNASKFAMEAATDSLRRELMGSGVGVSIVEPGSIATPIWEKSSAAADDLAAGMPPRAEELYGDMIAAARRLVARTAAAGLPPIKVARVVEHALTAERPRTRYVVGRDARARVILSKVLPDRAFDALTAQVLKRI